MNSKETKQMIKEMKALYKKILADKSGKLAHKFLVGAGIITEKGRLRKPYRQEKSEEL